jgi:Holliday junction resolvasome RuvABC endonuclease subunit
VSGRRIVGLDLSLSATGVASDAVAVYSSKLRGPARLAAMRDAILRVCDKPDTVVVVEGYAMGTGRQAGSYAIGELGGVVRLALHEAGVPYVEVPPAALKKFATSKGNANKIAMATAAAKHGYDGPDDDNAIDAWWLRNLGAYAEDLSIDAARTSYRDDVVAKVDWPAPA